MHVFCLIATLCGVLWCSAPLSSIPPRTSWLESANEPDCDFPVENLPYGIFRRFEEDEACIGVAIGDCVLDLRSSVNRSGTRGLKSPAARDSEQLSIVRT